MPKLTFILGGVRSGKSSYAQKLAEESGKSVTFIATAQALDEEMSARIKKHQVDRPTEWTTLEIPQSIASYLREHAAQTDIYLLDCITLLTNNIFMQFVENDLVNEEKAKQALENEIIELLTYIHEHEEEWIIISNEVGLGLVPPYQMGRVYRDLLGWINQSFANKADTVLFMVAGIPMVVKG
jgi:adenosylcobinamide kinase / adenosylcobinamide-phosphate guanylyltransferase